MQRLLDGITKNRETANRYEGQAAIYRLPVEVLIQIFSCSILSKGTLRALCLTCKKFNPLASDALYRHVTFEIVLTQKAYAIMENFSSIEHPNLRSTQELSIINAYADGAWVNVDCDPKLQRFNRAVEIIMLGLGDNRLRKFDLHAQIYHTSEPRNLSLALCKQQNLTHLSIPSFIIERWPAAELDRGLILLQALRIHDITTSNDISKAWKFLQTGQKCLKYLSIEWRPILIESDPPFYIGRGEHAQDQNPHNYTNMRLESLESLHFGYMYHLDQFFQNSAPRLYDPAMIRVLQLEECHKVGEFLKAALAQMVNLKSLVLWYCKDWQEALTAFDSGNRMPLLEDLCIAWRYFENSTFYHLPPHPGYKKTLKRLWFQIRSARPALDWPVFAGTKKINPETREIHGRPMRDLSRWDSLEELAIQCYIFEDSVPLLPRNLRVLRIVEADGRFPKRRILQGIWPLTYNHRLWAEEYPNLAEKVVQSHLDRLKGQEPKLEIIALISKEGPKEQPSIVQRSFEADIFTIHYIRNEEGVLTPVLQEISMSDFGRKYPDVKIIGAERNESGWDPIWG